MNVSIYAIKNLINNKVYIGSSKSPTRRKNEHFRHLKIGKHHSPHLQNSYNKYGKDKFSFYILEECEASKRVERETFHIELNKSDNREFGYNINGGDCGSFTCSPETRKKLSDANFKIPIDLYSTDGTFIKTFPSANECSIEYNMNSSLISQILKGVRKSYKGYTFTKQGEPFTYERSPKFRDMSLHYK